MKQESTIFRTAYGPHKRVQLSFTGNGRTKQSHRDECDINQILIRYQKTGTVTHANNYEAQYGDVTSIDLHEAMNIITQSEQMFEALPSSLRTKFKNNAGEFLDFVQNPDNQAELVTMGLSKKKEIDIAETQKEATKNAAPIGASVTDVVDEGAKKGD